MVSKLGAPGVSEEKAAESLKSALDPKSKKGDINYAELSEIVKVIQPGILINWGCEGVGFGQTCLYTQEGRLKIDDECMGKEFVKKLFNHIIDEAYKD